MNKLIFNLSDIAKKMWFRCLMYCLFALLAFFAGSTLGEYVPDHLKKIVSVSAVSDILKIIASSMLAVTTFSLAIMVQALSAAATTATPRANKLLMEDETAKNALGAFIGAFLFSIVGIIGISAEFYDEEIIAVLFIFTIVMIIVIIAMLLKWIDHLSKLGRVTVTIDLVEQALSKSIIDRSKQPYLYSNKLEKTVDQLNESMHPVISEQVGYVQYIDVEKLNEIALKNHVDIFVTVNAGKFLDSIEPLAYVEKKLSDEAKKEIISAFILGGDRTFVQDPRYGFIVLSEIALRALSPGINDPGTAIDIIGTYIRTVKLWVDSFHQNENQEKEIVIKYKHVFIKNICEKDILEDMYSALISDASQHLIVSIRLKKSLLTIKALGDTKFTESIGYWIERLDEMCAQSLCKEDLNRMGLIIANAP